MPVAAGRGASLHTLLDFQGMSCGGAGRGRSVGRNEPRDGCGSLLEAYAARARGMRRTPRMVSLRILLSHFFLHVSAL